MQLDRRPALIIFIKNPEKGKVKTRIAQSVGDDKALEVYLALLEHTRRMSLAVDARRYLYYSNFIDHSDAWAAAHFIKKLQRGADLGERMHNAFAETLPETDKAVIIGSDCLALQADFVEQAFQALDKYDYVIGPSTDGGYYLLGMKRANKALFEGIAWSTEVVLAHTLERIEQENATYLLLPALTDIDHWEDWLKA
ncbi:MAG TPA: TIGR04282 family arsenosugar biosynthesis glycosyltransferase [Saprospiraceae bacterium]|nr:TIGR04282 family arsenosugar biosynthesis glycosyltransferase [Saprospiraceae bacterium]HMQ83274.1 TIGR04282 family arsenosugar biosynthesis glycosyltransferase [Saprospiraceae bacterium]